MMLDRERSSNGLRGDDGSILPLTIFYAILGLVLVLLVVAATSLYLERKRLYTLADGAALAGAEAFPLDAVTLDGSTPRALLTSAEVDTAAREYLDGNADNELREIRLEQADTRDGTSATVRLSAVWHPPVVSLLVPDGITLEATALARSVFW
jgi:hypothetical protein